MKKLIYFIIPLVVGGIFLFGLNKFLDSKIDYMLEEKDLKPIMNNSLSNIKDKGVIANNHFLQKKDIMMLGSSELGHSTKQHPTYYFNTNRSKNGVITIGRAYTQNLQDTTILGSFDPSIKDKKVVLLVSMQWFMDKEGVTSHHYQTRFSPTQFYAFLNNPDISKENKIKFANRASKLLIGSEEYKSEAVYAKLYSSDTFVSKVEKVLLAPYFEFREDTVKLKEKGMLYERLVNLPDKKALAPGKPINWNKEMDQAIVDAKKRVGKNNLCIDKIYYKKNFGKNLDKVRGKYKDVNLVDSKEFDDYQLTLDVCNDLGIKPVIVLIPGMDKFYNVTGISKDERYEFYNKAGNLAKQHGFDVIDLRSKENEKYYLRDVMHLGTKGWVDVCEKLFKEFNQQ
ncbi:MAG: D-alanyl-lipoteichoic acid biosynthesis protein DltD [Paraclostridium bifermentans]|uniref:Protein DltD n=1 Tax=Paraclostridium bifermentans ATCC 638 = DSM 14991 TaxID=1233171 RepID=T4VE90_PARBF|nr:D-alanyl-lipoteichoic acid biosynthesis protein DltD [Paraclostridium bifermentans]EQK42044.1 D-alanyl-lipoteichoic acid biosynthesis protein DltD [[Clostridium] bifermentans ATCC 638] [Paraclostridium bifermentans ATCC 638 = DSM 14991]MBS6509834.1 D-alanyl-lipoteichoic acid biosynthesis protein DltD [Paraclostridium bifermentans]MDU3801604.1 D-alanyl-lipoteichoic acid biosynthesis protein DltD [Paraclostridium bifermentans]RIZ58805.1 D-alanyl-lipoteichoic acid biosynthesis protein DltD [Par